MISFLHTTKTYPDTIVHSFYRQCQRLGQIASPPLPTDTAYLRRQHPAVVGVEEDWRPSSFFENELMPMQHRMASHKPEKEIPLTETQCVMLEAAIERAWNSGVRLDDHELLVRWLKQQGVSDDLLDRRHREFILTLALKYACRANRDLGRRAALEFKPPTPPNDSLNDIDPDSLRNQGGGSVEQVTFDVSIT